MASIETIAVIGAGTMGHGIAQVAALNGFRVLLSDVDRETLARGVQSIERNLAKGISLGKLTDGDRDRTLQQIRGTIKLEAGETGSQARDPAATRIAIGSLVYFCQ